MTLERTGSVLKFAKANPQAGIEILEQLHLARRLGLRAVARDRHEIERAGYTNRPRKIREEDECAFENGDEVHAIRMVAIDLRRQFPYPMLDVVCVNEDLQRLGIFALMCLEHALHARVTYRSRPMKRFQMITEADARVLEYGSSVVLVAGGHVTPLALDTLRARRITVVREGVDVENERLAPPHEIRTIAIAGDHTSVALKTVLRDHLRGIGITVHDLGTDTSDPVDYPDTAAAVALEVARGEAHAGIVIDGAGLGSAIAANKIAGVRAAMCVNRTLARYAREHNGANVLALGSTLLSPDEAVTIVDAFVTTPMREARYIRRLAKIRDLEERPRR